MELITTTPILSKQYLCFTLTHDREHAIDRYRQKYGVFPLACLIFAGLLWLGPIPTQTPDPDPIQTQPEPFRVYEPVQLEMSL